MLYSNSNISNQTQLFQLSFLVIFFFAFNSCKKTVDPELTQKKFFNKLYNKPLNQINFYVSPTADNGFIMFGRDEIPGAGSDDYYNLLVTKTDVNGNELWSRTYEIPFFAACFVREVANGGFLVNSLTSGVLMLFDANGNHLHTETHYANEGFLYWAPLMASSRNMYTAGTNGLSTGAPSKAYMNVFDQTGTFNGYYYYDDSEFGGKIQQFAVWKADESTDQFWYCGSLFPKSPWNWNDPVKFFVARSKDANIEQVVFPDAGEINSSSYLAAYTPTADGGLLAITGKSAWFLGKYISPDMRVMRFDKDMKLLWEKKYRVGLTQTYPTSVDNCADGGFIISGNVDGSGSTATFGFLFKINGTGDKVWDHLYKAKVENAVFSALEYDGGYLVTGHTLAYGNGTDGTDGFLMRTDERGEVK